MRYSQSPRKLATQDQVPWAWLKCLREKVGRQSYTSYDVSLPVQILPWLFLSDELNVRDTGKLKRLGITHVLSTNEMSPRHADSLSSNFDANSIQHKHVYGLDEEDYDMISNHWEECYGFLRHVRESGGKVVVHCAAGINRSGLIACSAHMVLERSNLLDVVDHALDRRGTILWNRSFQKQLCILADSEGLLGDPPPGYSDDPIEDANLGPPPTSAINRLV